MISRLQFLSLVLFLIVNSSLAQVPEAFNYQGVLRNAEGELIKEQNVSIRIAILEGSLTGSEVYSEIHDVTTNKFGVFTLQVGDGQIEWGSFSTVNWSSGQVFMKTEVDETGGTSFTELGTVPFLSVPYAMFANDVANKDDADADPSNEIQNISLSGTALSISSGNSIDLSIIQDGVEDLDADPTNEIQDLSLNNNILTITNKESATAINLASYQGENTDEQILSLSGTDLSISGGNTIDVSSLQDGVDDADNNPTNELQNLSLNGDTLAIGNGNQIVLPYDSSLWAKNGNKVYYNSGNIGVGSSNPVSKLEVKSDATSGALFQVINANNDTVFAVYPDGVKVFVNPDAKGKIGGFAVSGRNPAKGNAVDIMRVTGDSTRFYVNETATKGKIGGFAVSGRNPAKTGIKDYFVINEDSTRIYVKDSTITKGKIGGFAVSGRNPAKGAEKPFMNMNRYNYLIGHESGIQLTSGLYNSTLGYQSGYAISSGENNAFMGYQSGYRTNTGSGNLFIGYQTGYSNQSGDYNTFLGFQAGYSNTDGLFNTYLGSVSGYSNQSGNNNTFVGDSTGYNNKGSSNSFFGTKTGLNNTSGYENVFIGNKCGYTNSTGFSNVYIGNKSGYNNNAYNNVLIGHEAGYSSNGGSNVIIGSRAAKNAGTGNSNVIVGRESGLNLTSGYSNVFIGEFSGMENADGFYNVYVGKGSGQYATGGGWNVSLGTNSGQHAAGLTNVFIGTQAGQYNEGSGNIMIGSNAGQNNNGYRNVFIGTNAGQNETGSKKLFIEVTNADSSMALIYGDFDTDWVRINDALGIGRNPEANNLEVEGTASKTTAGDWASNSDRRIKTDIQDINNSFQTILKLRPVKFKYTEQWKSRHPSVEDRFYYNFIAQEYQEVFPESVKGSGEYLEGDENEILQIDTYHAQIVTIKAVQDLIKENEEQNKVIENLIKENKELNQKLNKIIQSLETE